MTGGRRGTAGSGDERAEFDAQQQELRRAILDLEAARDRLAQLYGFAPVACLTWDADGVVLAANLALASMLGMAREELLKTPFPSLLADGWRDALRAHRRTVFGQGEGCTCEVQLQRPDGGKLWARLESRPVLDPRGDAMLCRTAVVDVTENTEDVPPTFEALLDLVHADDRRSVQEAMDRAAETGEPFELECRIVRPDGTVRSVVSRGTPDRNDQRRTVSVVGTLQDITEHKRVQEALLLSHNLLAIANRHTSVAPLLEECVREVRRFTGCQAVGMRLLDEEGNIPYEAYEGFSREFYRSESPLSVHADQCMCVYVVMGRADSRLPYYTEGGSFYMNGTTAFLATVSEEVKGKTRNVCNKFGFESVALVPVRVEDRILGLIHVADRREDMVPLAKVEALEAAALALGPAILRLKAEEALRAERDRAQKYLDTAGVLMVALDAEGRVELINRAGCELLGYEEQELVGKDWFATCLPERVRDDVRAAFDALIDGDLEPVEYFENPVLTRDGSERDVAWQNSVLTDEDGAVVGVLGSGTDITTRKRMERALRRSHERLERRVEERTTQLTVAYEVLKEGARSLVEAQRIAHLGNWTWNIVTDELKWSDEIYRIFGLEPQEFGATYEAFLARVHPDDRQAVERAVEEARFQGRPYSIDHRIVLPDGTERTVHERADLRVDEQGNAVEMIGTVHDVTERKEAEERLLAYQRELRSLSSGLLLAEQRERRRIAAALHDGIGQSLAACKIKLGQVLHAPGADRAAKLLREVRDMVDRMVHETRSLTFDLSPPVLYELGLVAAIEWLAEQMEARHGLRVAVANRAGPLLTSEETGVLLFQAVRELLLNVAKHSGVHAARVSIESDGRELRITVADEGAGFDPSALRPEGAGEGGFGLFSIRERLDLLGGGLDLASEPGGGATATLVVPVGDD